MMDLLRFDLTSAFLLDFLIACSVNSQPVSLLFSSRSRQLCCRHDLTLHHVRVCKFCPCACVTESSTHFIHAQRRSKSKHTSHR